MSTVNELEKLMVMLEKGLITRNEFDREKHKILDGGRPVPSGRPSSIGSYRITDEIGQGGMGRVYRGRHRTAEFAERQGGDVAIKVLHAQYAERKEIVERFEREAALGIKLDHPGIVRVHELTVDAGRVALVMELVEGRPLSEIIGTETGPIPWSRAQPMVTELLDAIRYAHSQGVVHRDLKPENIMVSPEGQLKILDFGIAKDLSSGRTKTGTGMGTVDYMAPEQYIDAKAVDARADIYALGMTIYEMLAGRLPWGEEASEFSVLEAKKNGQIPTPTNFYPDIPEEVVAVVMRMLRPDKRARYGNADAVETALNEAEAAIVRAEETRRAEAARRVDEARRADETPLAEPNASSTTPSEKHRPPAWWKRHRHMLLVGLFVGIGIGLEAAWNLFFFPASLINIEVGRISAGTTLVVDVGEVEFEEAYIPIGTFAMGTPTPFDRWQDDYLGVREVRITQDLHMGVTEVTQELYTEVTGEEPWISCERDSTRSNPSHPAVCLSWIEIIEFCNALSELLNLEPVFEEVTSDDKGGFHINSQASGYRLPTEAEWEYAARAGHHQTFAGSDDVNDVAWYRGNSGSQLHRVAIRAHNAWGLFDMSGNADERVQRINGRVDATSFKFTRGGSYRDGAEAVRADYSSDVADGGSHVDVGFRIVRNAE